MPAIAAPRWARGRLHLERVDSPHLESSVPVRRQRFACRAQNGSAALPLAWFACRDNCLRAAEEATQGEDADHEDGDRDGNHYQNENRVLFQLTHAARFSIVVDLWR